MEITTAEEQRDYKSLTASLKILPAQLFGGKKCISLTLGSQKWLIAKAIKEKPWKESHPGPAIALWVSREQGIRLPSLFCCCVWNRADSEEGLSHNCVALDKKRMGAEQSSRMNLHGYYLFHRREMEAERSLVFFLQHFSSQRLGKRSRWSTYCPVRKAKAAGWATRAILPFPWLHGSPPPRPLLFLQQVPCQVSKQRREK